MPQLIVFDPDGDDTSGLDLTKLFNEQRIKVDSEKFSVNKSQFEMRHMLLRKQGSIKHELHFCAHDQAISSDSLDARLSDLKAKITDPESDEPVIYHGYVSGEFLDDSVTPDRTDFEKYESNGHLQNDELVAWDDLVKVTVDKAEEFLEPLTNSVKEAKERRISEHVRTEAPWFRHVVKHRPDLVARISPTVTGNELDLALYQASQEQDHDLRKQAIDLLEFEDAVDDPDDYRKRLDKFLEEFGAAGTDQLAKYVAHRKAILSFLADRLKRRNNGKYHLEEDIHQVIFPMRATSDDVSADRMNLWIIDERLAFHHYLASDRPLHSIEPLDVESKKEPDILIFDRPHFMGEQEVEIGAAIVVEFKRPMTDDRNPITQVFGYVRKLRSGTVSRHGRPLKVNNGTPFYAYILCDLTPRMREYAEDAGFTVTPDEQGYMGFNGAHSVYLEVISYDKAVADAQKRNAVLFHKLGLPMDLTRPGDTKNEGE